MRKPLQQAVFVVLLAVLGFLFGGAAGAATVPAGAGLAGGATVFVWGAGGLVAGAIGAVVLITRLSPAQFRIAFLAAVVLTVLGAAWMGTRVVSQQRSELPLGPGAAHVA